MNPHYVDLNRPMYEAWLYTQMVIEVALAIIIVAWNPFYAMGGATVS